MRPVGLLALVLVACSSPSKRAAHVAPPPPGVSGRLIDVDGKPVAGAIVRTWRTEPALVTTTDDDGEFAFPDIPPGYTYLVAHRDDDLLGTTPIFVGGATGRYLLRMLRGKTLVVRVTDETGAPIAGVKVSDQLHDVVAGADGVAVLRGFRGWGGGGALVEAVCAEADGYLPGCVEASTDEDPGARVELAVSLVRGEWPLPSTDDDPDAQGRVAGIVVDADGAPVASARISGLGRVGEVITDADGRFSVEGIRPWRRDVWAWLGDRASPAVAVDANRNEPELRLTLEPSHLRGQVVDARGDPVAGAWAGAQLEGRPEWRGPVVVTADENGKFDFGPLPPGSYRITGGTSPRETFDDGGEPVRVRTNGEPVRIALEDPATVTGRVMLGGKPVTQFSVYAIKGGPQRNHAFHTDDAVFSMTLMANTSSISIDGEFPRHRIYLDLEPGERRDLGTINLDPGIELQGVVVDDNGNPVEGATVAAGREPDPTRSVPRGTTTDRSGTFRIRGFDPDSGFTIAAAHAQLGRSDAIKVPTDGSTIRLTLRALGRIEGTVEGWSQVAPIHLQARSLDQAGMEDNGYPNGTTGAFHIDGLLPGRYDLRMGGPGKGYRSIGTAEVVASSTTRVALVALPLISVDVSTKGSRCDLVTLSSGFGDDEAYFHSTCDGDGGPAHIGWVLPGVYTLCLDSVCDDVTVAATPAKQLLELSRR